jgi:hypothetical protein
MYVCVCVYVCMCVHMHLKYLGTIFSGGLCRHDDDDVKV